VPSHPVGRRRPSSRQGRDLAGVLVDEFHGEIVRVAILPPARGEEALGRLEIGDGLGLGTRHEDEIEAKPEPRAGGRGSGRYGTPRASPGPPKAGRLPEARCPHRPDDFESSRALTASTTTTTMATTGSIWALLHSSRAAWSARASSDGSTNRVPSRQRSSSDSESSTRTVEGPVARVRGRAAAQPKAASATSARVVEPLSGAPAHDARAEGRRPRLEFTGAPPRGAPRHGALGPLRPRGSRPARRACAGVRSPRRSPASRARRRWRRPARRYRRGR